VPTVSEYPSIVINATDVEARLVDVDKGALPHALHEKRLRSTIVLGKRFHEIDDACLRGGLVEQVLHRLGNRTEWKAKDNPLITRPSPKAVPESLGTEPINERWFIKVIRIGIIFSEKSNARTSSAQRGPLKPSNYSGPIASWTVALFACVLVTVFLHPV
jgi:hypothetical protein